MSGLFKLVFVIAIAILFVNYTSAQDLGSSNKLFGGKKAKPATSPTAKAKSKPKPKAVASKTRPKPKTTTAERKVKPSTEKTAANRAEPKAKPVKKEIAKSTPKKTPATTKTEKPVASDKTVDGRFSSFKTNTKHVTESSKRLYEQLVDEGNRRRSDRNYPAAETAYQKAKALDAKDARAIYGLGTIYSDQQRWEDAEAAYRAALKIDPKDPVAHIALSYVLTQPLSVDNLSERYDEAEKLARKAIELAPSNALASDQLGVALELKGLTGSETENAYRTAIRLDPYFAPAHAHLGRLLRRRGQSQASRDAYQSAIDKAKDPSSLIVVAEVMQSEQRYADSESLLRRALDDDPKNAAALLLLGRALTVGGDLADAEIMLRRALDVSPNGYLPNFLLGELYLRQRKHGQAEMAFFQAERSVPDGGHRQLARALEKLGDDYFNGGKLANAERCYRAAARLDKDNAALTAKIARAHG